MYVHAMFHHYIPPPPKLVVKPARMAGRLLPKVTWRDHLPIDMVLSAVLCCAVLFSAVLLVVHYQIPMLWREF